MSDQVPSKGIGSPTNYTEDFSALSARAQAVIEALVSAQAVEVLKSVIWDVSADLDVNVLEPVADKHSILTELIFVSQEDTSGTNARTVTVTNVGSGDFETFPWTDLGLGSDPLRVGRMAFSGGPGGHITETSIQAEINALGGGSVLVLSMGFRVTAIQP